MDTRISEENISKESFYKAIKRDVRSAIVYRDNGKMEEALMFADMALSKFKTLCYLGIGYDDNFSECYDFYAEKTGIQNIVDLTTVLTNTINDKIHNSTINILH